MIINNRNRSVALITGASKRIGKSIALELHGRNVDIVLHCNRSKLESEALCSQLNGERNESCLVINKDFTNKNASAVIINSVIKHFGRLDYLINNASIFYPTPVMALTPFDIHRFLTINAIQPKKLIQLASKELMKRNGAIVNILDIYAQRGHINHSAYVASKSVLSELTKQFALELAPTIRVNSVSPGAILWPEVESNEQKEQRLSILANSALKRIGDATDISKTVAFLLLDGTYITGANINVDGGRDLYI